MGRKKKKFTLKFNSCHPKEKREKNYE